MDNFTRGLSCYWSSNILRHYDWWGKNHGQCYWSSPFWALLLVLAHFWALRLDGGKIMGNAIGPHTFSGSAIGWGKITGTAIGPQTFSGSGIGWGKITGTAIGPQTFSGSAIGWGQNHGAVVAPNNRWLRTKVYSTFPHLYWRFKNSTFFIVLAVVVQMPIFKWEEPERQDRVVVWHTTHICIIIPCCLYIYFYVVSVYSARCYVYT